MKNHEQVGTVEKNTEKTSPWDKLKKTIFASEKQIHRR